MSGRKYSKSFEVALSAVSAAVAVAGLLFGVFVPYMLYVGYAIAIAALMVPLTKGFFVGDALAFAATCILALVLGVAVRFWDLVPFIMFFGLHPLLNALQLRYKINKWLAFIIKAIWCDCTLIAAYFLIFGGVIGISYLPEKITEILNNYIYVLIFTLGTLLFFVYDLLVFSFQRALNLLVYRIKK